MIVVLLLLALLGMGAMALLPPRRDKNSLSNVIEYRRRRFPLQDGTCDRRRAWRHNSRADGDPSNRGDVVRSRAGSNLPALSPGDGASVRGVDGGGRAGSRDDREDRARIDEAALR